MSTSRLSKLIGTSIANRYRIVDEIGQGGMGRVFRAMPFDDPSQDVAIKVILRDRQINSEDLMRFQKEAALMSKLHHPNIICFYELGLLDPDGKAESEFGHGYYIVMEIANGTNLKQSLEKEGRKELSFFFQLALKVADALDYTHGKNIIHRDIKPQNIIVGRDLHEAKSLNVKVLDFGVARLVEALNFSAEGQSKKNADIAGTPLYMAPEQTSLMDAEIDHRVDLYSLGCVLYEVLTGRPPFTASTREKLEREHVYSRPEPLTSLRPDLPQIIEEIIHKLLAKHPNDRYQSAFSLKTDLMRARRRLERKERPSAVLFPLASNDRFRSVSAQLDLVGREQDLQFLVSGYENIVSEKGRSRLAVVKGVAGAGKTRLLAEFRNYLSKRRIRFVTANFSQHENTLPFNALANGFNDYLIRLIKANPYEAEELRRKVKTMLGPIAHHVAAVVPGLKPYITGEAAIPEPESKSTDFATFAKAFSDFTRCLAVDNQPVVFIFDDLHWADTKSLDLIDQFFSHNNSQRFFMIIGYRSNDPLISPRFNEFLDKFRKLKRRFEEVELCSLDRAAVKTLVGNILDSPTDAGDDLVDYIERLSAGNPLYVVEIMRVLVSADLVRMSQRESRWGYDMDQLNSSEIKFNSLDLVLSRLLDYQGYDRAVLELAAVVGMSFQFELLTAEEGVDSVRALNALNRAIEEGLVVRSPDEQEFIHLGKTYSFTHWRARDLIYRNIDGDRRQVLHARIAQLLRRLSDKPTAKVVFALAHHLNSAVATKKAESAELAVLCIDANIAAGKEATKTSAWQSAQRYFENAYTQMEYWPVGSQLLQKRSFVIESLGDLAALQRRFGDAMRHFNQLATMPLDRDTTAALAYKRIKLQLSAGIISSSVALVKSSLRSLGLPLPTQTWGNRINYLWEIMVDVVSFNLANHRLVRLLQRAKRRLKDSKKSTERSFFATKIYEVGEQTYKQYKPMRADMFHHFEFKQALAGKASPFSTIRVIGDRAARLGRMGFYKLSYAILDATMEVARASGNRNLYGYICLMRTIFVDYLRDRDDEIKVNIRAALRYLSAEEERIWYGTTLEFAMFVDVLKGRIGHVAQQSVTIPDFIQTRNWISPRAMAMVFYCWLLADTRDQLVSKAELYLRRRDQVAGRANDLFVLIIQTMLAYAKGEMDKTRSYYMAAMATFVKGQENTALYPFEEDFVGLFALTFPPLFEQEHRRALMRDAEIKSNYLLIEQRISKIPGQTRGIVYLLRARTSELLKRRNVKVLYDEALKAAKLTDNHLLLIFSYLWFGDTLLRAGGKFRNEYLRRAHDKAVALKLNAVVEYTEKLMEQRKVDFRKANVTQGARGTAIKSGPYRSRLVYEHIEHIASIMSLDTALEQHLEESLAILGRYYLTDRIICLLSRDNGQSVRIVYPYHLDSDEQKVTDYLFPYMNIRSSLFLPLSDAPWVKQKRDGAVNLSVGDYQVVQTRPGRSPSEAPQDLDRTVILDGGQNSGADTAKRMQTQQNDASQNNVSHTMLDAAHRSSLQMSALVPIRFNDQTIGVLLLEDLDLSNKDTTACRNELDVFGAQLGILMAQKQLGLFTSREIKGPARSVSMEYHPGAHFIEESSWLRLWSHGRLRTGRESGWYLGLNYGAEHYLLMYCRFNGSQEIRERFSALLWYQVLTMRTQAVSSGRADFDVVEFKDEIAAHMNAYAPAKQLDTLSIAFTLFSKEHRAAKSGHFGPSRPLVLCQDNLVAPENRIFMTLENGRDVRFWAVEAAMKGPHVYILTHDPSKLEVTTSESQRQSLLTSIRETRGEAELHSIVERLVMKDNMPRYYVAGVILLPETVKESMQKSKAS